MQTEIKIHNSLGLGERYHQPLRNTFRQVSLTHSHVLKAVRLMMAVKAMNDTLGPEGIVPSDLVFGEYPQIRASGVGRLYCPDLAERAIIAEEARNELSAQMAKIWLECALRHRVPLSVMHTYSPGDIVLV